MNRDFKYENQALDVPGIQLIGFVRVRPTRSRTRRRPSPPGSDRAAGTEHRTDAWS